MNMPILAHTDACITERHVGQGSRRELSAPRHESWRAMILGMTLAILIFTSTILLSSCTGEAANTGCDSALLYLAGNPTRTADAHAWGTTYRTAPSAGEVTTHAPLIAGKHAAHFAKGAG